MTGVRARPDGRLASPRVSIITMRMKLTDAQIKAAEDVLILFFLAKAAMDIAWEHAPMSSEWLTYMAKVESFMVEANRIGTAATAKPRAVGQA